MHIQPTITKFTGAYFCGEVFSNALLNLPRRGFIISFVYNITLIFSKANSKANFQDSKVDNITHVKEMQQQTIPK